MRNSFLPTGVACVLALTLVLATSVGRAAAPVDETPAALHRLTLRMAIAYALTHQPELLAARDRLRAARDEAEVPSAQWLPSFGVLGEFVESTTNNSTATPLTDRAVDLPRIGGTTVHTDPVWRPDATTLLAVGGRQEIFDFGRIAAQSAAARALAAIEVSNLRQTQLDVRLAVASAYYAVRAAWALLDVATQAESRAAVHRDYAQAAVRSGLRSPIEVTRADADVTRFEVARIRAQGSLVVSRGVFSAAIGYSDPEVDAADEPSDDPPLPALVDAEARAVELDPAVQVAVGQVRAERALSESIGAASRPNLFATAEASLRAGGAASSNAIVPDGRGLEPDVPNYSAGVVLSWQLFDATVAARERAARTREQAFASGVEVARQRAFARTRQAYQNVEIASAALVALRRAVDAARANHEQAEARFRAGLGTSTELADAETLRLNAEEEQVLGRFQAATARAEFSHAVAEEP
jgi:outer membrane protein